MKEERNKVELVLNSEISKLVSNRKLTKNIISELRNRYNMPEAMSSDYLSMRKNLFEADDFTLFALTNVLCPKKGYDWFSTSEIKHYSKDKFVIEKIKFPLKYKVIQIRDDQFIGKITVKDLMQLRDAQLINYNENAQRTMRHTVKNGEEIYQISLNKKQISAIQESYIEDEYIPNTITLNIPEGSLFDYDEDSNMLIIREMDYFDILDGYHRYVAMSKIFAQDHNFDYEMELRITNFSDDKGRRFIWQEDQKTKMTKVNSDSMNSSKISNKIVERMNRDSGFILSSKISRNRGLIDAAELANIIEVVWLKGMEKDDELTSMLYITDKLTQDFEKVIQTDGSLLKNKWDKKLVLTVVYDSKRDAIQSVIKDYKKIVSDKTIYANNRLAQIDITRIEKLLRK